MLSGRAGTLSRWPFGPLGVLAAPFFEHALDNSEQLYLGSGFTLAKETVDIELRGIAPALASMAQRYAQAQSLLSERAGCAFHCLRNHSYGRFAF